MEREGNTLDGIPESVYRLIFLGIVFYFALLLYGQVADEPLAADASQFVFGVIAIGVGTVLYLQTRGDDGRTAGSGNASASTSGLGNGAGDGWPILTAAVCLVVGGILQFAFLFTQVVVLDTASSLFVFAGIGCYIYAVWYAG